jgi:hypothetical protein
MEQTHVGPKSVYGELPLPRRLMIATAIEFLVIFPAEFRLVRHRIDEEIETHIRFFVIAGRGRMVMLSAVMAVVVRHAYPVAVFYHRGDDVDKRRTAAKEGYRRRDAKGGGASRHQDET